MLSSFGPGGDERSKAPIGGQTAHHDQMVEREPLRVDKVGNAQIDVGREPPVQLHLAMAGQLTHPAATEVEEPKRHGFFSL